MSGSFLPWKSLTSVNYSLRTTFTVLMSGGHAPPLQQERVAQALSLFSRLLHRTSTEFVEIFTLPVMVLRKWNRGKEVDSLRSRAYLTTTKFWEDVGHQLFGLSLEYGEYSKLLCHQFEVPKINSRKLKSFMKCSVTLICSPTKSRFNPLWYCTPFDTAGTQYYYLWLLILPAKHFIGVLFNDVFSGSAIPLV